MNAPRSIEIKWEDPTALAAAATEGAGLGFLRRIRGGELSPAPIQRLLGFELVEAEEGRVVNCGSRVATAEGRLTRERNSRLLAHGASTCLLIDG